MSFQAKRLRVQLPCGDATVIEEEAQAAQGCVRGTIGCAFPTRVCEGGTCWFETPINCGFVSPCGGFASFCDFHTACRLITVCKFDTCGLTRPKCFVFTAVECPPLTDLQAHPGRPLERQRL